MRRMAVVMVTTTWMTRSTGEVHCCRAGCSAAAAEAQRDAVHTTLLLCVHACAVLADACR